MSLSGAPVNYTIADKGALGINSQSGAITDPIGLASASVSVPDTGLMGHNMIIIVIAVIAGLIMILLASRSMPNLASRK